MMHGRERSGPTIVAVKPTNEAGDRPREPVEPWAGAKENADDTLRTPGREGASHGLSRVRQAARLKKEERFTALLHHVDADALGRAYHALKRGGDSRRASKACIALSAWPVSPRPAR